MDTKIPDKVFYSMLERTGGARDIKKAMEGKDLADVVQAAIGALKKTLSIPMRITEKKSTEKSNELRNEGNLHYGNGEYKEAILLYNKALAYAPNNSMEIKLAYSNISAVLLAIKAYEACQETIKECLKMDCPKFLTDKLHKRMNESYKYINDEMMQKLTIREGDDFLKNYLNFDVKRNSEVPCASEDVSVETTDGLKKMVAARDIKAGTIVALERAFVSTQKDKEKYLSCYYCHRIWFFFIPCDGCSHALFCNEECRKKCMEEYHHIECHIVPFMGTVYVDPVHKLMTRTAIKMSLELGWDKLRAASLDIGREKLKSSTVKEAFDVSSPVSILCYDDSRSGFPDKIFDGSLMCAPAVHCLSEVPGYFPEGGKKRTEAIDAISRIMLHLYATFTNRIEIISSAYDLKMGVYKCAAQRNIGWFSFASKLPHSCEPNLFTMGLNDRVALVALQTIKKGDALTITYVDHFYDSVTPIQVIWPILPQIPRYRQLCITDAIHHHCECRVCTQEWDTNSHTAANLTSDQKKAFEKLTKVLEAGKVSGIGNRFKIAAEALDSLTGLNNKTQHKRAYFELKSALNVIQCAYKHNKGYGVVPPSRSYTKGDEKVFVYKTKES